MKIVIFGISSFIGFNCARKLSKNHEIIGLLSGYKSKFSSIKKLRLNSLSKDIKIDKCNILNKKKLSKLIAKEKPDVIINSSGYTKNYTTKKFNNSDGMKINVEAIQPMMDAYKIIKKKVKIFIQIGSAWEYSQKIQCCKETSKTKPEIPYGLQKLNATLLLKKNKNKGIKIIILRVFNLFGKLDNESKLFPYIFKKIKDNKSPELSSGYQKRDYIHVNDLCDSIDKILKKKKYLDNFQIFNICRGKAYSIKYLLKILTNNIKNNKILVRYNFKKNRKFENKIFFGSNKKILSFIKWKPTNINNSIKQLIKDYK